MISWKFLTKHSWIPRQSASSHSIQFLKWKQAAWTKSRTQTTAETCLQSLRYSRSTTLANILPLQRLSGSHNKMPQEKTSKQFGKISLLRLGISMPGTPPWRKSSMVVMQNNLHWTRLTQTMKQFAFVSYSSVSNHELRWIRKNWRKNSSARFRSLRKPTIQVNGRITQKLQSHGASLRSVKNARAGILQSDRAVSLRLILLKA